MNSNTKFQELSRDLSIKDRTELLNKIKQSLNIDESRDSSVFQQEMNRDEKALHLKEDMQKLTLFARFIVWIKSKLSGRAELDVLLAGKITRLKRKIRHQHSNLTGFETRNLTPHFAELVYALYHRAIPLRHLFKKLWIEENIFQAFFLNVVESRIKRIITIPEDLLELDKIVEVYGVNGKKEDIHRVVLKALDDFIAGLDKKIFSELESELQAFYYLKDIVLFPFVQFFQQFGYTLDESTLGEQPKFKNASALVCLNDLEKLYCALYSASKLDKNVTMNKLLKDKIELLNSVDISTEEVTESSDDISELLSDMIESAQNFYSSIPLSEIIKYFKKNPYYKVIFYLPRIDLTEFYRNTLRIRLMDECENKFPEIQKRYIDIETGKLFKGKRFSGFQNYREYASIDYKKLGVSAFSQIKALELIYNYLACFFRGYIQETVKLLERGILSQNRLIRDNMLQYAAAMEDIEEKIRFFDEALAPDAEEGKLFHKLRFSMAKDPVQQKMYRKFVIQKDRDAKTLSETGIEAISGIKRVFGEILKSKNTTIVEQLDQHFFVNNNPTLLKDLLSEQIAHMHQLEHLYHHVLTS